MSKLFNKKFSNMGLIEFISKHRVVSICVAAVLIVALISLVAYGVVSLANPLYGYAQVAAERGKITKTVDVEGTLVSGDRYEITSLVAGKVISSDFEVGDKVAQNDIIYKLDDTEAKLAVDRAKNEADKANDTSTRTTPTTYRILAPEEGTVQSLSIKTGSTVTPGSQVGTLRRADGTTTAITSYISGTIIVTSVRVGQSLSAGQVIASINPSNALTETNTDYYKKNTDIDLQSAQRHLDNYSINAPVDGVIVEKNTKVGDNVAATDMDNPMMVIVDTSKLRFSFSVDEHSVDNFKKGQSASVKSDSVPDTVFSGEVSSVSNEGTPDDNGNLMFEVTITVTLDDLDSLKAGMKVSATIVLDSEINALLVPERALMESDGKNALVLIKSKNSNKNTDQDVSETSENELNYPWIKVPKGCELVSVEYGLSDGTNVKIISGIKLGDIVVYKPKNETSFVPAAIEDDADNLEIETSQSAGFDTSDEQDLTIDDTETDEETKQQVRDEIERLLQQ